MPLVAHAPRDSSARSTTKHASGDLRIRFYRWSPDEATTPLIGRLPNLSKAGLAENDGGQRRAGVV